jgi:hypothetical protein
MRIFEWFRDHVVARIIANILFLLLVFFAGTLKDAFLNWLSQRTYSGPIIEGGWNAAFEFEKVKGEEIIHIVQHGQIVSGEISSSTIDSSGFKHILESKIIGEIRDDYLVAYYVPEKGYSIGCGSFTLKLIDGGNTLSGYCPFQYSKTRELKIISYIWHRFDRLNT